MPETPPQPDEAAKPPYHAPTLRKLGSVSEMTQTTGGGVIDDGVGYAAYAS